MPNRLKPSATARIKTGYRLTLVYEDGSETVLGFAKYSSVISYLANDAIPELVTASIQTLYSEPGVPVKLEVKHDA